MEKDEVERELQTERQANKKFGALRSSRNSRVALRLRSNSIDGEKEKEREDDEEPDVSVDILATISKQQTFARRPITSPIQSTSRMLRSMMRLIRYRLGRLHVIGRRAAPVSADDQINDNCPTENSDTEEAHSAQTRIIRSGQSVPSKSKIDSLYSYF